MLARSTGGRAPTAVALEADALADGGTAVDALAAVVVALDAESGDDGARPRPPQLQATKEVTSGPSAASTDQRGARFGGRCFGERESFIRGVLACGHRADARAAPVTLAQLGGDRGIRGADSRCRRSTADPSRGVGFGCCLVEARVGRGLRPLACARLVLLDGGEGCARLDGRASPLGDDGGASARSMRSRLPITNAASCA
jgi:hypothetical protein